MSVASLGNFELKVTPEVLKNKADEVTRRIRNLTSLFSELENEVTGTQSFWIGEAGDAHRQTYLDERDDLNAMLQRLKEHPKDLLLISGNYEEAEQTILESVDTLSTNAIDW